DVRAVMDEMGKAMMGTGEADGEDRAVQAAEKAIANPLLDEISLRGAKGVLINITGGYDLTLFELDEAANRIREEVDPDANIIVGSTLDTEMSGKMRVSVVATGIDAVEQRADLTPPRRRAEAPGRVAVPATQAAAPQSGYAAAQMRAQEPAPERYAERTPERAAPAAQPEAAPAFQRRPAAEAPSLFDEDALPPPAYRPQPAPEARAPVMHADWDDEAAADPAPPVARSPGTPTPEALARLRAAVGKTVAATEPRSYAAPQAPEPVAEKPRFGGLNTLINRMTGHAADPQPQPAPRAAPPLRQPPAMHGGSDAGRGDGAHDQERIEIPAFLRRQAN
ncbi:MAG: cell division protein FtsZ, partial [Rhodobacteraceae bacterium]|nr:cell division protein FtsZ [Paracoccaceae bacterium]